MIVGQVFAMLFMLYGIFFNWWLALIGFFLYMGAGSEKQHVMLRLVLHGVPARDAMATDYKSLSPDEPLSRALEHVYHGCQDDFPVVDENGIQGILTRMCVLAAIHEKGTDISVAEAMDRGFLSVDQQTPLDEVYRKLLTKQKSSAAVVEGGELKGMLCQDGISRHLMIRSALKGWRTADIEAA